ncbi:MAG: Uma2 family endonuclease [Acidobacteriota bacterium]
MSEPQISIQPPIPALPSFDVEGAEDWESEEGVPELETGDRLKWDEFERRYDAMPNLKKAELIKGVVYMGSPVRHKRHGKPNCEMAGWILVYAAATPGTDYSTNGTVHLSDEDGPQPDVFLRLVPEAGGASHEDEEDYISGPPELVIEIASSSVSYDLHDKKDTYGQFGVTEYVVWRANNHKIDWFRLENNQYISIAPNADGIIESSVFPGLRLNIPAMLAGNMAAVLAELQKGLNSPEHSAFVERLAAASQRKSED